MNRYVHRPETLSSFLSLIHKLALNGVVSHDFGKHRMKSPQDEKPTVSVDS